MAQAGRASGLRLERIKASPRFSGRTFINTNPVSQGLKEGVERPTIGELLCGGERIPSSPLRLVNPVERWTKPPETGLRVTWLGHSTMLNEIDGVRVLTDPVWGSAPPQCRSPAPSASIRRPRLSRRCHHSTR